MPKAAELPQWPDMTAPSLLSQASLVLAREALRLPASLVTATPPAPPGPDARTGFGMANGPGLRAQAQDLLASLLAIVGQFPSGADTPAGATCPVTHRTVPAGGFDLDTLRKQAHEFIDALLVTFHQTTGEQGASADERIPAIQGVAPVQPGSEARATLRVANEEPTASDVTLYCTNFVTESGYEIPALRVSIVPRRVTIPPKGEVAFEIRIAVPQQTARGIYSGLIQAMGSKFAKAVLSIDVL